MHASGETAAPSPESPLVIVGDCQLAQVRAEFEERDIGKMRVGTGRHRAVGCFPRPGLRGQGRTPSPRRWARARLGQRGPRRPTDVDVLEVIIDLDGKPPLLPGMRVDVFLRADLAGQPAAAANQAAPATKANEPVKPG